MSGAPDRSPLEVDDDDALSWGGDTTDASYVEDPARARAAVDAFSVDLDDDDDDELPEGVLSSGMLVLHGVFAAILLLYTVAWLLAVTRATEPGLTGISLALWHVSQWLAVFAPATWFAATLLATPVRPARRRVIWLIVAVLVLFPWQYAYGGAA